MITSVNLCGTPFQSNTDSTRLQMVSKQIQQTLVHKNCETPYVIDENYNMISQYSPLGIYIAKDNGYVTYKNSDIIVINYNDLGVEVHEIPEIKKCSAIYASNLRFCLDQGTHFKKGDIIFEYADFRNGVLSCGYNVFSAYNVWFGFNHEDSLVISESFANRAKYNSYEKITIPIYEYTLLDIIYPDGFLYFPKIGQQVKKKTVCQNFIPKDIDETNCNTINLKEKVLKILKSMSVSDYIKLNRHDSEINNFKKQETSTKIKDGILSGFKIHKINEKKLIDKKLQDVLEKLHNVYSQHILDTYNEFINNFSDSFSKKLLKEYYVFTNKNDDKIKLDINMSDCVYIIEFEITKEDHSYIGDKFTNRYAGKGVCSLILPDDLRPIALQSNKPIDLLFNPFGVYSRMNLGQVIDGAISKTVMFCDEQIKSDESKTKEIISWLNDNIIYHLNENKEYYLRIKNEIIKNLDDDNFKQKFLDNIKKDHLFIEGPCFSHIDLRKLQENLINVNEDILIKKETINYISDRLKIKNDFVVTQDIIRRNIFCAPMYINKLYKLTKSIINARDFGQVKDITQQPLRGRAQGGGSRLGQMEIEAILASGCDLSVKEFLTIKSDHSDEKRKIVKQIIETGQFHLPEKFETSGRTKKVVSTILNFLKE